MKLRKIVTEKENFKTLIVYPNLSMMLTPSYAIGLWTAILKQQGYIVDLFDCTSYMPNYEFVGDKNPDQENIKASVEKSGTATRANKLMASRKFDPIKLFGTPKTDLLGDFRAKIEDFKQKLKEKCIFLILSELVVLANENAVPVPSWRHEVVQDPRFSC